jgi:hypothetical protein
VELGVALRWPSVQLQGIGSWFFERNGQAGASGSSAGARLGLATGTLLGCTRVSSLDAVLPLSVCTGVEAGQLRGQGTRVAVPRSARALWMAVRLEVEASWRPAGGPLMLKAGVGAAAPLTRDEFVLADIGSVHRPGSVVGRLRLGLSFDLH